MDYSIKKSCGLTYLDFQSDKPHAIIFIHGNSHSKMSFLNQLNDQKFSQYRLIAIDLPGHGDSDTLAGYTLIQMADTLANLIFDLNLIDFIVVGHSLGGHVATQLLNRVSPKALALFGTPPLEKPLSMEGFLPNPLATPLALEQTSISDLNLLADEFGYKNQDKEIFIKDYSKTDIKFRSTIFGSVFQGHYEDEQILLSQFKGIVLGIISARDGIVNSNFIRSEYSDLGFKIIDIDSGHCPHVEIAEQFNTLLSLFADEVFTDTGFQRSKAQFNL
jgi:pimeloyl-ACP methyl ester carboxylesterase